MLNTQPFSILIISTCSTQQDIHIYGLKTAKGEDEICITWNWRLLYTCSYRIKSSRSTPMNFCWSFVQKESVETTWIHLNFQLPSPCSCSCTARFLAELIQTNDDSCSVKHQEQEYAKILENCLRKMKMRRERNFGEFFNFRSEMVCYGSYG